MTKPAHYDPEARFDAVLSRAITLGVLSYRAHARLNASGALLNRIIAEHGGDAIVSADPR